MRRKVRDDPQSGEMITTNESLSHPQSGWVVGRWIMEFDVEPDFPTTDQQHPRTLLEMRGELRLYSDFYSEGVVLKAKGWRGSASLPWDSDHKKVPRSSG